MAANPVARMAAASVACWALVSFLAGGTNRSAVFLGMLGPLMAAVASWAIVERVHARAPERVSGVMIRLFGAKVVLFGAYVAAVVMLIPTAIVAFAVSFTAQYVLLHVMEAFYLRRLFSGGTPA
jgi:hypothetical protein